MNEEHFTQLIRAFYAAKNARDEDAPYVVRDVLDPLNKKLRDAGEPVLIELRAMLSQESPATELPPGAKRVGIVNGKTGRIFELFTQLEGDAVEYPEGENAATTRIFIVETIATMIVGESMPKAEHRTPDPLPAGQAAILELAEKLLPNLQRADEELVGAIELAREQDYGASIGIVAEVERITVRWNLETARRDAVELREAFKIAVRTLTPSAQGANIEKWPSVRQIAAGVGELNWGAATMALYDLGDTFHVPADVTASPMQETSPVDPQKDAEHTPSRDFYAASAESYIATFGPTIAAADLPIFRQCILQYHQQFREIARLQNEPLDSKPSEKLRAIFEGHLETSVFFFQGWSFVRTDLVTDEAVRRLQSIVAGVLARMNGATYPATHFALTILPIPDGTPTPTLDAMWLRLWEITKNRPDRQDELADNETKAGQLRVVRCYAGLMLQLHKIVSGLWKYRGLSITADDMENEIKIVQSVYTAWANGVGLEIDRSQIDSVVNAATEEMKQSLLANKPEPAKPLPSPKVDEPASQPQSGGGYQPQELELDCVKVVTEAAKPLTQDKIAEALGRDNNGDLKGALASCNRNGLLINKRDGKGYHLPSWIKA